MRRHAGQIGYPASCGSGAFALAVNRFISNRVKPIPWTNFAHCLLFARFAAHSVGDASTGFRFEAWNERNLVPEELILIQDSDLSARRRHCHFRTLQPVWTHVDLFTGFIPVQAAGEKSRDCEGSSCLHVAELEHSDI